MAHFTHIAQKGPKSPFSAIFTHFHPFGVFWVKGVKMGFWAKRGYFGENGVFGVYGSEWPILAYSEGIWLRIGQIG